MGARGGQRRRIDPANMPIWPAIDQIDPPVSSVPEHHRRRARQVEFPHRFADGQSFERGGRFSDDRRIGGGLGRFAREGRRHRLGNDRSLAPAARVLFEARL